MKPITIAFKRILRPCGGLFFGVCLHLPCTVIGSLSSVLDAQGEIEPRRDQPVKYSHTTIRIGLLAWEIVIGFNRRVSP